MHVSRATHLRPKFRRQLVDLMKYAPAQLLSERWVLSTCVCFLHNCPVVQVDFVMRMASTTADCQSRRTPMPHTPFSSHSTYHTTAVRDPLSADGDGALWPGVAGAACSALGLRGSVDVTLVILHVSEETSVARQLQRAQTAAAHNAKVAACGHGEFMCATGLPGTHVHI